MRGPVERTTSGQCRAEQRIGRRQPAERAVQPPERLEQLGLHRRITVQRSCLLRPAIDQRDHPERVRRPNRLVLVALLSLSLGAFAQADKTDFAIAIKDHKFSPDRIEVPAGKKVKLVVENQDATPEEFESHSLKVEKVIPGKSKATIFIGPLKAGEYKFVGEFNEKTAKGVIVAK